jgi:uncharacterized membrane protein (DUF106 family)
MAIVMGVIETLFDVFMRPLSALGAGWAMMVLSILTGIIMLVIYRYTSNQKGIRRVKNRIKAHFLELRLFKDDLRITLRAQGRILRHNLTYMRYALMPMMVMIVPVLLLLVQMHAWFAFRPLEPGEKTLVTAHLTEWDDNTARSLALETPEGVTAETPGVCVPDRQEVVWRVRADAAGTHKLTISYGDQRFDANLVVGATMARTDGGRALPKGSVPSSIDIDYIPTSVPFFIWKVNWLLLFFILSIAFGFLTKGFFGVEI